MDFPDIDNLLSLQAHLSNLTGFYLSVYGEKGNVILPPANENKLLSFIKSTENGKEEYNEFIKNNIEQSIYRSDISLFRCPAGQYHFFVPLHIENSSFILAGGGVYLSAEDFENFYREKGSSYGLSPYQLKSWYPEFKIMDYPGIQNTARHIHSIFSLVLRNGYNSSTNEKRYKLMKTVLSLVSDIKLDKHANEVYDMLADILLFLFNADSISIMIKDNNIFTSKKAAGRLKDHLQSVALKITGIISEVIEKERPFYSESVMDLLRLGLSDDVTSMYAFPVISENNVTGILGIFNTEILQEDAEIISEICKIAGCIFKLMEMQSIYDKCIREIDVLNKAASRLIPIKDPDTLYETILDTSVLLAGAEKGSLMLADDDTTYLTIKAAKGIHKRLFSEIKIKAGEGIAGKVFSDGMLLMVDNIEENEWRGFRKRTKYRTGSFISIPLKIGEKTIGVLNISDKITGELFSKEDLSLLSSFTSYASIALERSNYYSLAGHLKELSITDSLTGLFNRRYFEERFYEEIHRSNRHNLSFSLAMLDIDDFKLFNDTEGHLSGDEMLKYIANIAKDSLRVIDVIARFGGEEFAVIMPQTEKEEAFLVAERIRNSVRKQLPFTLHAFPRDNITISIGIATYPYDGKDRKELIRNADRALYKGKMEGKDRTVLWSS